MFVLRVYLTGIVAVLVATIATHGVLQGTDCAGIPYMVFTTHAHGIFAADIERIFQHCILAKSPLMTHQRFLRHFRKANAFNCGGSAGEIMVDKILRQTDGIKNLRAAIGLIG